MATSIRFGNNVFQKEKKILLLEQELSQLQVAFAQLTSSHNSLLQSYTSSEHIISNMKQKIDLQEVELLNKGRNLTKITQEKEKWLQENEVIIKENEDLKQMNEKLRTNIEEISQKLLISMDLENRLRQEIRSLEGNNEKLERNMEKIKKNLDEKTENIEILEKSIAQKDKFNAIIMKEKERLMKTTPFEGFLHSKEKEVKSKVLSKNKENIRKNENKAVGLHYEKPNDDENELKRKVKEIENENEKLKKQNFELLVRIKNKKNDK